MSDDRSYIERAQAAAENWLGESKSPDQILEHFLLLNPERRAQELDRFDNLMQDADTSNLEKFSADANLHRRMKALHVRLKGVNR